MIVICTVYGICIHALTKPCRKFFEFNLNNVIAEILTVVKEFLAL